MKDYRTIITTNLDSVLYIDLDRPEIHNAFDDILISELNDICNVVKEDKSIRCLVVTGRGKSFCAGADLNWMKKMKDFSFEENYQDSLCLSKMFHNLASLSIPTIAKVNGATIGGGVGIVAACDLAISSSSSIFSLSEVRLGIVPACISPYLIQKVNPGMLRSLFLTGTRFDAVKAKEIGLVHEISSPDMLDETVSKIVHKILACGPNALATAKEVLTIVPGMSAEKYQEYTARVIAQLRVSPEGQEGLSAFLEKRKPNWNKG